MKYAQQHRGARRQHIPRGKNHSSSLRRIGRVQAGIELPAKKCLSISEALCDKLERMHFLDTSPEIVGVLRSQTGVFEACVNFQCW